MPMEKMKENNKHMRAINFDLSIVALAEHYSRSNPKGAYKDINAFFKKNGFEHRQGSGYCSNKELSDLEVICVIDEMFKAMPWLDECSKKIDVTSIDSIYDVKELRSFREQRSNVDIQKEFKDGSFHNHGDKKSILKRLEENKERLIQSDTSRHDIICQHENER